MWGNLSLASEETREVPVPLLLPGQVGVVSVAFVAPVMEGTYTSHWRLAHCGCQFGPRVWCSIVVEQGDGCDAPGNQSKRLASQLSNDTVRSSAVDVCIYIFFLFVIPERISRFNQVMFSGAWVYVTTLSDKYWYFTHIPDYKKKFRNSKNTLLILNK